MQFNHTHTHTYTERNLPFPPSLQPGMQRLYETIKLFSFPFLTLKRNAKKAAKSSKGGGGGGWGSSSSQERRRTKRELHTAAKKVCERRRRRRTREEAQILFSSYTRLLVSVSVAMAHPLHYIFWPCCCLKVLRLPRPAPCLPPSARETHPKACGLLFALLCLSV